MTDELRKEFCTECGKEMEIVRPPHANYIVLKCPDSCEQNIPWPGIKQEKP